MKVFATLLLVLMLCSSPLSVWAGDVQGAPLKGEELEIARKMNEAYARSMYSSICLDRQRALFMPVILTPEEKSKKLKEFSQSCECLADMVIKETSPNDVIGFVTKYNGKNTAKSKENGGQPKELNANGHKIQTAVRHDQQTAKLWEITTGKESRKKCGFSQ